MLLGCWCNDDGKQHFEQQMEIAEYVQHDGAAERKKRELDPVVKNQRENILRAAVCDPVSKISPHIKDCTFYYNGVSNECQSVNGYFSL